MVYSREHNSLAHRSMVGNYCKFIRAARFQPSPPPRSPAAASALVSPVSRFHPTFSIFRSHPPRPPSATRKKSPRLSLPPPPNPAFRHLPPDPPAVRKPLLAKLKLRHSARNAETI